MKKEKVKLTQKFAENSPSGGVVVGERNGQTMIYDDASVGGYFVGKTHSKGGIKMVNKSNGEALEVQGSEVIITAPAVADQTKREFEGKMMTNREILSKINEKGGGVSFAKGGTIPKNIKRTGASYKYGGKIMTDHEIYKSITGGHLADGMSLSQIAKKHNVSLQHLQKQAKIGVTVEKEHTSVKREQMKIVKDHLYENPDYYTLLKKAKLEKGGGLSKNLAENSKKGNSPSRDLNNYNDLIDVQSDGKVGGDTGIDINEIGTASASGNVGVFQNGGDLDFLNDVDRVFVGGGTTELPIIDYCTVSDAGSSLSQLVGKRYDSYYEFRESVEKAYTEIGRKVRSWVSLHFFDVNSNRIITILNISDQKNTVKNFNPFTGNQNSLVKIIKKIRPSSFPRYNWDEWFSFKKSNKKEGENEGSKAENKENKSSDSNTSDNGELGVFLQIDAIVRKNSIERIAKGYFYKDSHTKDFDVVNTVTGNVYTFRIYGQSLAIAGEKEGNQDWSKILQKYEKWKESNKSTSTATPPEPKQEEQPVRNFELEKKYLTQRINTLSSELDLKRPILSNDEVAFYQREINKFVSKLRNVSNDEMELKPIEDRIKGVYKVKWGDYNKEYQKCNLKSINGIDSELTFEEYMTVRTPEFMSFFGNWEQAYLDNTYSGISKIINPKTKEPMPVFHGTNVLFTEWKVYETNNAHYFAVKREMSDFFASSWETRTDKAGVDSRAIKALNPNTGKFLYRCFLDIRNPIDFSKFGVEKRPIKEFLLFLKINYNIGDYDFWTNVGKSSGLTKETKVFAWQIIRLWQNFTKYVKTFTTYDGYIFYEYIPDTPYGGLENASLSFCAFESNQIKFADAYEFNALSNDSRFDFGGKL